MERVAAKDCHDVVIHNSSIRQVGMNALNVSVVRDAVWLRQRLRAGQGCVALGGGNRTTLTRSNHFVNDSRLVDCQRVTMNYAPNVLMSELVKRFHVAFSRRVHSKRFVMGVDRIALSVFQLLTCQRAPCITKLHE